MSEGSATPDAKSPIELANPPGVLFPQAHYSQVARVDRLLYVSGQLAFALDGSVVGLGDARVQARQCWANMAAILSAYGVGVERLLKTTTFITHHAYRGPVAEARDEVFPAPPYPANTLVVVQGLAEPHFLVEIEAVAHLG